jgi:carbamoyltransferase
MGLAPYGRPIYADLIREHLIDIKPDGSFWMDMRYFDYCHGLTMTNRAFSKLVGTPPRRPEGLIEQMHIDLAASIQLVTEEIVLAMGNYIHAQTGEKQLVLAGGVALNCVANGRLLREGPFEDIWVQPAAGDAGGALGSALFVWHQLLRQPREVKALDGQQGSLLGPRYDNDQIACMLDQRQANYRRYESEETLVERVAELLTEEKVVGWFHGRMEYGPRALGGRSILGDARSPKMQSVMNLKIKYRESFRPFAPIVTREQASEWFDLDQRHESPYMLIVAPVLPSRRCALDELQQKRQAEASDLRERVNFLRSEIPAVTHVDYSARLQTVDENRHPRLHRLLQRFDLQTGCPVLVNTSFNVRGEPIVCTPEDAYRCFLATEMDALVMEDCLILKAEREMSESVAQRDSHLAQFELD